MNRLISLKNSFSYFSAILLVVLMFLASNSIAQKGATVTVKFILEVDKGNMKNALITITKNGLAYKVIDPDGGKYTVELELGAQYLVTCTKMGYISKTLIFDSHVPSGREADNFAMCKITVELHPQPQDQIVTYSQPVGKFKYSMETLDFAYDKDYTQQALQMQKKDEEHPVSVPKPPTPNPKPLPPPALPPQVVEKSKPIPIAVEPPKTIHYDNKNLPEGTDVVPYTKPIVRAVTKREITEDRKKITLVTVNIDGTDIIYKREQYSWGGVFFYKGATIITERTFAKETE